MSIFSMVIKMKIIFNNNYTFEFRRVEQYDMGICCWFCLQFCWGYFVVIWYSMVLQVFMPLDESFECIKILILFTFHLPKNTRILQIFQLNIKSMDFPQQLLTKNIEIMLLWKSIKLILHLLFTMIFAFLLA